MSKNGSLSKHKQKSRYNQSYDILKSHDIY